MSDPIVPFWLQEHFGGYLYSYEGRGPNHKPFHRWSLANAKAAEFCRLIGPYLKLKDRQAQLVADFHQQRLTANSRSRGLPDDELAKRRSAAREIKSLNQRGLVGAAGGGLD